MTPSDDFLLREMIPDDSDGVRDLMVEGEGMMTTYFALPAYRVMIELADLPTVGVVALAPEQAALAGVATIRTGICQYNGDELPFGFLDSVKVSEKFRQRGLATLMGDWLIAQAREKLGDDLLLLSGTSTNNHASQNWMRKWSDTLTEPMSITVTGTTRRPPKRPNALTFREATPDDYAALANHRNHYYARHNYYTRTSAEKLATEANTRPVKNPLFQHYVVAGADGALLAGATVTSKGDLMYDVIRPPLLLKLVNTFVRMIPSDGILRSVGLTGLWFAGGNTAAARYLVESLRYQYRDAAPTLFVNVDSRDPIAAVVSRKRFIPLPQLVMAVKGPTLPDADRPAYIIGRA